MSQTLLRSVHVGFGIAMTGNRWWSPEGMIVHKRVIQELVKRGMPPEKFIRRMVGINGIVLTIVIHEDAFKRLKSRKRTVQQFLLNAIDLRGPKLKEAFISTMKDRTLIIDAVQASPALYGNCEQDGYFYINTVAPLEMDEIGMAHELMHEVGLAGPRDEEALAVVDRRLVAEAGINLSAFAAKTKGIDESSRLLNASGTMPAVSPRPPTAEPVVETAIATTKKSGELVVTSESGLKQVTIQTARGSSQVPIWTRQPIRAVVHRKQLLDFAVPGADSLPDTVKAVDRLAMEAAKSSVGQEAISELAFNRARVAEEHGADVFALIRKGKGLENAEEVLFEKLLALADLDKGLKMFEEHFVLNHPEMMTAAGITKVTTIQHLNRLIPDITTYEVLIISLLDRVPMAFVRYKPGTVPMLRDFFMDGAMFHTDEFVVDADPYSQLLVITAKHEGVEFVRYKTKVRQIIDRILRLKMNDALLFERSMDRLATPGLRRGYDMVRKTPGFHISSQVENLITGHRFSPEDMVRLIGLLAHVPAVFCGETPFIGFAVPYGAGVKFVAPNGILLEYVAMHTFVQGSAFEELGALTEEDLSPTNPLMAAASRELRRALEDRLDRQSGNWSRLDELAADAAAEFSLSVPIGTRKFFDVNLESESQSTARSDLNAGSAFYTLKMGTEELGDLLSGFRLLPENLRRQIFPGRVHRVLKQQGVKEMLINFKENGLIGGWYESLSRSIYLMDYPEALGTYANMTPELKQVHRETVMHEVGEAVFALIPERAQMAWNSISEWTEVYKRGEPESGEQRHKINPENLKRHFMTAYATHASNDDFSEHFELYVYHGPEFRALVQTDTQGALAKKYQFLRRLFEGVEYERMSSYSVTELNGEVVKWADRLGITQALRETERAKEKRREMLYSDSKQILESTEETLAKEGGHHPRQRPIHGNAAKEKSITVNVMLPSHLARKYQGQERPLGVKGDTIPEMLGRLFERYPGLQEDLFDKSGNPLSNVVFSSHGSRIPLDWRTYTFEPGDFLTIIWNDKPEEGPDEVEVPLYSESWKYMPPSLRWLGLFGLVCLEEAAHLLTAYGLKRGILEIWRQRSGLYSGSVNTSLSGAKRPLATAAIGVLASAIAGTLLLSTDWHFMLIPVRALGGLTLLRVGVDMLLYWRNPQHELRPVAQFIQQRLFLQAA